MNLRIDSRIYNKDNVSVFAVLKNKKIANQIVIVANTHILFNMNRGDIKIAQVKQILNALSKLEEKYSIFLIN
jgi:protein angel